MLARTDGVTGFNDLSTTDDGGVLAGVLRFRPMAGEAPVPGELWLVAPAASKAEPRVLAEGIL